MSLQIISQPAVEPVSLADAKAHLKVDVSDDDALIARLIPAARARAEWHLGRALITQSWRLWRDQWPCDGIIEIPLPPLQSVSSVTIYALDDTATVLDPATYQVDAASQPARLTLKATVLPPTNTRAINAVAIEFTAGYGRRRQRRSVRHLRSDPRADRVSVREPRRSAGRAAARLPRPAGPIPHVSFVASPPPTRGGRSF